jgi:hypothetical protein
MMKHNARLLATLATLLLAMPALANEAGSGRTFMPGVQAERPPEVLATELRPLNDPENPYAGQYEEWDIWAYEHFRPGLNAQAIMAELQPPERDGSRVRLASPLYLWNDADGNPVLMIGQRVDNDGFLVPAQLADQNDGRQQRRFGSGAGQTVLEMAQAFASGPIELAQYDAWQLQITADAACKHAPIPAFIGEHPPVCIVFVPNGEFAVKGMLGLGDTEHYDMQASGDLAARERWYRYSPEGELLGMTGVVGMGWRDDSWMLLYWPDLPEKIEEMKAQGLTPKFRSGTVSFAPDTTRSYTSEADSLWDRDRPWPQTTAADVVECYDYLGQPYPVELAWPAEGRPENRAQQLDAPIVKTYYEAQLSVGYTTDAPSPHAGQANGPQLATADYFPPVVAYPAIGGDYSFTEKLIVKALDAPGNPYAGQYSEWDRLCYEHYGEHNEEYSQIFSEELDARQKLASDAKAQGQTLEEFKQANPGLNFGMESELMEDAGIVSMFCYVDDEGYLIPMSLTRSSPGGGLNKDYRTDWNISATISMDAQQRARYEEWQATLGGQM